MKEQRRGRAQFEAYNVSACVVSCCVVLYVTERWPKKIKSTFNHGLKLGLFFGLSKIT